MNIRLLRISTSLFLLLDAVLLSPDLSLVVGPSAIVASPVSSPYRILIEAMGSQTIIFHWAIHISLILISLFSTPVFLVDLFLWISTALFASAWNLNIYGLHFYILFSLFLVVSSRFLEMSELRTYGKILFALTYFNSGFSKLMTPEWRSGDALHLIFSSPELGGYPVIERFWWVIPSWSLMIIQLTYPVTSFFRKWRIPLLVLVSLSHFLIAFTMEFIIFSIYLMILNFIFLEQKIPENFSALSPSRKGPEEA